MYNDLFIDAAEKIFRDLQLKYNFFIKKQGSFLTYSNCNVAFTIYFERQFEIYINMHIQSKNLRLIDIMKWLHYPEQDIITVKNNQIHDQQGMLRVLHALERIMQGLLANFEKLQNDLPLIQKNQELCEKQAIIMEQLERSWREKEYTTYYQIYHSNQNILGSAVNFPLISKRAEYAKKMK